MILLACAAPEPAPTGPCAEERFEDLRTLCLVQRASEAARAGDEAAAGSACAAVREARWGQECWFRVGEELGAGGRIPAAMQACAKAGEFASFCVTHAGWRARPTEDPLSLWAEAAAVLPEPQRTEAAALLPARWWFNRVYGTGVADPSLATDPASRTAWALEALRLSDGDLAAARRAWTEKIVLRGPALPPEARLGRYDLGIRIPGEDAPRVPVFGGAERLVGADEAEDLEIALLEAAYFREATGAEAFRPHLDEPRPRLRWTAVRLFRILPSADAEAVMRRLSADPDPVVRAHAEDALKYRSWEGKPNAPGLRKR